jgi:hypothetical protein
LAGVDKKILSIPDNVTLFEPLILINPEEAFPYATVDMLYRQVKGGILSVNRQGFWKSLTLSNGWSARFGSTHTQPSYRVSLDGTVELRGEIAGGSSSTITTLPEEYRPYEIVRMFVPGSAGTHLITINPSGTIVSDLLTPFSLNSIRFSRTN